MLHNRHNSGSYGMQKNILHRNMQKQKHHKFRKKVYIKNFFPINYKLVKQLNNLQRQMTVCFLLVDGKTELTPPPL